ncbi:MAG: PTS IIA-like nitrogen regulatory protein PtsN [Xanthomonadales bacterium]|nr:PTS IIA-like nitrogen regulatory protein PtsN [Xanthomonadales bacterium]
MFISDLLSVEKIHCDVKISSKKHLLELISKELSRDSGQLGQREVFENLFARERLGSTGLGKGVAIPHARIKGSDQVEALFLRLKKPVPFDASDGQPVDLLFAMTVPEDCSEDHLKLLAQVARIFSDEELRKKLRAAESPNEILRLLSAAR